MTQQYLEHFANILNTSEYLAAMALDYLELMGEDDGTLSNNDITEYSVTTTQETLITVDTPAQETAILSPLLRE